MAALADLVNFQLQSAQALSELLSSEKSAITSRKSSEIERIAKEKVVLVEQLKSTDQRIATHTNVAELNEKPELIELVAKIRSIVHDCQQANLANGEALNRAHLSFNKLSNMMQQSHGKIGMTYNAGGQTHTISTLGTNVKA
ncbi:flagellar export chaperone FlgN [Vibrio sp. D404a]|uniref:flagella synthesis protein FlgN n=1 Tax=unclassified Vibrio TaxID=2614977 RepID=UPI0025548D73|nr:MULTISPECIES: flagellar export chaperone FlgN [unclassified Vibrio]MDK9739237.1 flagellar export chaperone FlgN [Vibrio sp. D404a]MDK9798567.1 flagellar export chaperone FlgN [Vibrio sp. D449a]